MKKIAIIISLFATVLSSCAQISTMTIDKGQVFPKEYSNQSLPFQSQSRFTPSLREVASVESVIKEQLAVLNEGQVNQGDRCPVIDEKLKSYYRQYVGYVDENGNRIVWINFLWKKEHKKSEIEEDVVLVFDGCSYYWNIKVNLDQKKAFDLFINGSA